MGLFSLLPFDLTNRALGRYLTSGDGRLDLGLFREKPEQLLTEYRDQDIAKQVRKTERMQEFVNTRRDQEFAGVGNDPGLRQDAQNQLLSAHLAGPRGRDT